MIIIIVTQWYVNKHTQKEFITVIFTLLDTQQCVARSNNDNNNNSNKRRGKDGRGCVCVWVKNPLFHILYDNICISCRIVFRSFYVFAFSFFDSYFTYVFRFINYDKAALKKKHKKETTE